MQHRYPCKTFFTATVIGALLTSTCPQACVDDVDKAKPLALRKNMQGITDAISFED